MALSPSRHSLYRRACRVVILAAMAVILAQSAPSQSARKPRKGLRALGLVELPANGKAHLVPIAIMADGKFYDASAYKAAPVPLALYSDTVYEAERSGVSQGLFTVTGALQMKDTWIGEGTWQPGGAPVKPRHAATDTKPRLDDDEGPPRLRGRGSNRPSPPENQPQANPPDAKPSTPPPASSTPTPATPPTAPTQSAPAEPSSPSSDDNDPNRPMLKRGKPQPSTGAHATSAPAARASGSAPAKPSSAKTEVKTEAKSEKETAAVQFIAAISDAAGPDLRPYTYDLKPAEEQSYRRKIMVLATDAAQARAREIVPVMPGSAPKAATGARSAKTKQPQPTFDDVHFNAFDLWNTNEPVFVFSARAQMPPDSHTAVSPGDVTYFITVVAKADIYGEMRKLFINATDTRHLDQTPRMELIDAVDADGDSRGELLFRQIYDHGVAWAVYRAAADQLYPLYEGTPTAPTESLPSVN